jgi:hypothetical protein
MTTWRELAAEYSELKLWERDTVSAAENSRYDWWLCWISSNRELRQLVATIADEQDAAFARIWQTVYEHLRDTYNTERRMRPTPTEPQNGSDKGRKAGGRG